MRDYIDVDQREPILNNYDRFKKFIKKTFDKELFIGLWIVLREAIKKDNTHTIMYPMEKMEMSPRYRGIHKLMRLLESGNERCIGCGLCEKICPSNCIGMNTCLNKDGRKKVLNYSINFSRCVYCGLCAEVCPELAITHTSEYEFASEQRALFGFKSEILTKPYNLNTQTEFQGYGSLSSNSSNRVKFTPTSYLNNDKECQGEQNV